MSDRPDVRTDELSRRAFLAASAGGALAALLPGCTEAPPEAIVPYVERPPELTPGESRYYATAALRDGLAIGILAESRDGRPIKIEGHPAHPSSLGATGAREQALVLSLYDRDRLDAIAHRGRPASLDALARALGPDADRPFVRRRGEGLHLWLEPTSSPLIEELLQRVRDRYPLARVHVHASRAPITRWEGARRAFGRVVDPRYRFDEAHRVLALDSDFLCDDPASLLWSRQWASRRNPDERTMSRCYAVESTPTPTGIACDHREIARASEIGTIAAAILSHLRPGMTPVPTPHARFCEVVARDLGAHRGRTIVIVGDRQPAHVHVLGHLINAALGNVGQTVGSARSPWMDAGGESYDSARLLDPLDRRRVDALVSLGGNPAFTTPGAMRFGERVRAARDFVHLASFADETARLATWVLPAAHMLERWGDARAHDGTWTSIQPLIRPLFHGIAPEQLLGVLIGEPSFDVRRALHDRLAREEHDLEAVLSRGLVEGSAFAEEAVTPSANALDGALRDLHANEHAYELELRPDPRIGDGSDGENAWLLELPEPVTKLVWGNAALLNDDDARELGVGQGDVLELTVGEREARLPAFVVEGQARGTIVAWLGFGRRAGGRVVRGVGVDLHPLRNMHEAWQLTRARRTGESREIVTTQRHFELPQHSDEIILRRTLDQYRADPLFAEQHDERPPSLQHARPRSRTQWGMVIDLGVCTGCSACVIACQAENDVPVVGREQVARGREMHWLRIDRYEHSQKRATMQPMLCQHCEQAPCEYVCPTNATVHSPDGLNEMVYNRCVGTRFCSNNCPYKVRRFNWFDFRAGQREPEPMVANPDVTVRGRGVMEKCTYCVQRIRRGEIKARTERRRIEDGEVITACAQACPTGAIVFGLVSDPHSQVAQRRASPRAYGVLNELGADPRTRYLARVDNESPERLR